MTSPPSPSALEAGPALPAVPQLRTDFWALLESAGLWLAVLLAGLVLMLAMLLALQRTEAQLFRDARLVLVLQEMREVVESELALGLELADIAQTRVLLEGALLSDNSLLNADVMDTQGLLLFSTDRGSVGESAAQALIAIAQLHAEKSGQSKTQKTPRLAYWSAISEDDRTLGLPIRNSFAQTVGHISVSALPVQTIRPAWIGWAGLGLGAAIALMAWFAARWASRRDHQASSQALPLQQAAGVLHICSQRQEQALARLVADQEQVL